MDQLLYRSANKMLLSHWCDQGFVVESKTRLHILINCLKRKQNLLSPGCDLSTVVKGDTLGGLVTQFATCLEIGGGVSVIGPGAQGVDVVEDAVRAVADADGVDRWGDGG